MEEIKPFYVRDCALAAIATGEKAQNLHEFRDKLLSAHHGCIYYHFWGGRLRTSFEYREYHNDFSFWSHHCLHDDILAERLELLDPTDFVTTENLQNELVEIVDARLDELDVIPWSKPGEQFHFVRSKIIVFQTRYSLSRPEELVTIIPKLTNSSLFYHFIDSARRLPERNDDFSAWLQGFEGEYQELITRLHRIDPYLIRLGSLKEKLTTIFTEYFSNHE